MFKLIDNNRYVIEEFRDLGIEAFYSTRELDFDTFNRETLNDYKIFHVHQTHTNKVVFIDKNSSIEEISKLEADGLVTNSEKIALYTKHADCLALYFYDRVSGGIGLCHSGWKGSFHEIGKVTLDTMITRFGSKLEDIIVGIGIGICQDNYEVGLEFFQEFQNKFPMDFINRSFYNRDEKIYFDNGKFNEILLESYGIPKENITLSDICTFNNQELHSHRRDNKMAGRNRAYIYK